ncbi:MAG: transketolase [Patescibacteria group bacterium]
MKLTLQELSHLARDIRKETLRIIADAKSCHVGSCFSCIDILTALYFHTLRIDPKNPPWSERDRFIMSKGHGVAALYVTLAKRGFCSPDILTHYIKDGSALAGHVTRTAMPGIEASTGSLGHGLSIGVGMALALKKDQPQSRVFVLLSDGECDEGSTWEAALSAGHFGLDNLIAIVDYNKIQSYGRIAEVMDLEPLADKWRAFRFEVRELDGHDFSALITAFSHLPLQYGKPTLILAHTIKGKGVSFMENDFEWHYHTPTSQQVEDGICELYQRYA